MAPERRRSRRGYRRWTRGHNGGRVDRREDTIAGDPVRKVLDSYCPFCATDIRSMGPRRLVRCPNVALCGKILPIDDNTCPSCCHYIRPGDNFCRICRANLRGVVRGRGGLYQQIRRAPSPVNNISPPREQMDHPESSEEDGSNNSLQDNEFPDADDLAGERIDDWGDDGDEEGVEDQDRNINDEVGEIRNNEEHLNPWDENQPVERRLLIVQNDEHSN